MQVTIFTWTWTTLPAARIRRSSSSESIPDSFLINKFPYPIHDFPEISFPGKDASGLKHLTKASSEQVEHAKIGAIHLDHCFGSRCFEY
ncbi:MAG: hypothetical protein ABS69_06150 [Nitrosomonadales bacterium SCN 54-20]|nr:MAG: hypothetical protein ABS69_06150 [Nitrosomonadales bacterium SCN 54-20]